MVAIVLSLQPRTTSSKSGMNPDQMVEDLANQIEEGLPEELTREGANSKLFVANKEGLIPSLSTFLLQEMDRFNLLLTIMRKTLSELKKASAVS